MNWFERWFNLDYLTIYSGRDGVEAARQIAALLSWCPNLSPDASVLDIATGTGRHRRALEEARPGALVTGIDLSWDLLTADRANLGGRRVRADMRKLPFRDATFELISSFFTSFGYFERDDEHVRMLEEWHRVGRRNGYLLLDYLNPELVLETLVARSEREVNGTSVVEERTFVAASNRLEKRITLDDGATKRSYLESVRLFSHLEMSTMLAESGFHLLNTYGDFVERGDSFGCPWSSSAPRMILVAKRS